MTDFYGEYVPDAHGAPLHDVVVRLAEPTDLPACAGLIARREGEDAEAWVGRLEFWVASGQQVFAAILHGEVVGYARLAWLNPVASGGRGAPDGWYLSGIVVDRRYRRRGIGRALTQARCRWAWQRGERVYFVANALNRSSLDLHRELGFRELTRDFMLPGITFSADGVGVLFCADADSQRQQVTQLRVRAAG